MEGFELINKYNERCLQWRAECCKLLSEWALAELDAKPQQEQRGALTGFLCARGATTRELLEAVHSTRIEHVVLALRYLRDRLYPKKPTCEFCTEPGGEHVAACLGEVPQCSAAWCGDIGTLECHLPTGHLGHHQWAKRSEASK